MATPSRHALDVLAGILKDTSITTLAQRLRPRIPDEHDPLPHGIPGKGDYSSEAMHARHKALSEHGITTCEIARHHVDPASLQGNIEHFIGMIQIPVGVIGPLRINGIAAHGDFFIPMATSEGALVASYDRGAKAVSLAGGVTVACIREAVTRAPCFVFISMIEAGIFLSEAISLFDMLADVVRRTSRYCVLKDIRTTLAGKELFLHFDFSTGDAAGQNMVTLATEAVCRALLSKTSVTPERWYIEGNMSGDKKATGLAFTSVRGKKVVADIILPKEIVREILLATPEEIHRYWEVAVVGGLQSAGIGMQGHYANALAALFMACGQDVACIAEAAVGITRIDVTREGDLYTSVTLPNLIVGTVGGGTHLPTARECLGMLGCVGEGTASKFAEICAAVTLAGELSICAALAKGHFSHAHAVLGRKQ